MPGSRAELTAADIEAALGYMPAGAWATFHVTEGFARPDTEMVYDAGDVIGDHPAAGSLNAVPAAVPNTTSLGGAFYGCRVFTDKADGAVLYLRVHLYDVKPLCFAGDGEPWLTGAGESWLGSFDVVVRARFQNGMSGYGGPTDGRPIPFSSATTHVLLQALEGYAADPGQTFSITLDGRKAVMTSSF